MTAQSDSGEREAVWFPHEDRDLFETLVQTAGAVVVLLDTECRIRVFNAYAEQITGYAAAEVLGQSWIELFIPDAHQAEVWHVWKDVVLGQDLHWGHENPIRCKDGSERWIAWNGSRLTDGAGRTTAVLSVGTDITGRRLDRELLLEQQERLRALDTQLILTEQRERRELAARLHDEVGQGLALAKIRLGQLEHGQGSFSELRRQLDEVIRQVRSLTAELSPMVLFQVGLEAALDSLCQELGGACDTSFEVRERGEPAPLTDELKILLYRGAREAIHNAVRHGGATRCEVELCWAPDELAITVQDDGKGMVEDRPHAPASGSSTWWSG